MRPVFDEQRANVSTDFGSIPWDKVNSRPVDFSGKAGRDYQQALNDNGMTEPDEWVAPSVEPSFLARELLAQLTPSDYSAIQTAVASNASLGLLWAALLAQGDAPIQASSQRFQAGWAGLTAALGATRAAAIAEAVGIPNT